MTSGGLWNYYGYEIDDADYESVGKSFGSDGKSFGYKTNCRKNTKKTSTTRSRRTRKSASTTTNASFTC